MMGENYSVEYCSYLLRLWRNHPEQGWRVSATDTSTGRVHHFASLKEFVRFVEGQADTPPTNAPPS